MASSAGPQHSLARRVGRWQWQREEEEKEEEEEIRTGNGEQSDERFRV